METRKQRCANCLIDRDPFSNDPNVCKREWLRAGMPGLWGVAGVTWGFLGTKIGFSWRPLLRLHPASWITFVGLFSLAAFSIWLLRWAGHIWRFRFFREFGLGADGLALLPSVLSGFMAVSLYQYFYHNVLLNPGTWLGALAFFILFSVWAAGELSCCNCANRVGWRYYDRAACTDCKRRKGAAPAA